MAQKNLSSGTRPGASRLFFTLSVLISVLVMGTASAAASSMSASRTLPAGYSAGTPATVSLTMNPSSDLVVYLVEETVPNGWTVSGLTDGGVWFPDSDLIKWGPFDGPGSPMPGPGTKTLTYQATPPAGTTGAQTFSGTVTYDAGESVTTGGATTISPQAAASNPPIVPPTKETSGGMDMVWIVVVVIVVLAALLLVLRSRKPPAKKA